MASGPGLRDTVFHSGFILKKPLLLHNYITSAKYFSVIKLTFFLADSSCAISQLVQKAEKAGVTFNRTV